MRFIVDFTAVALLALAWFEVMWPLLMGTPLFPLLRNKRERSLIEEIRLARQHQVEQDLTHELMSLREKSNGKSESDSRV